VRHYAIIWRRLPTRAGLHSLTPPTRIGLPVAARYTEFEVTGRLRHDVRELTPSGGGIDDVPRCGRQLAADIGRGAQVIDQFVEEAREVHGLGCRLGLVGA
jgi:hypothetical protein